VTGAEVAALADAARLRLVRFLWCGNDGTVRAKASSRHGLEDRIRAGIGLTVAMQAMSSLDQLQPVEGMGPVGEVRLVPDPATFRVLPYAPNTGAMLVDHHFLEASFENESTPSTACRRRSASARSSSTRPRDWPSATQSSRRHSRTSSRSRCVATTATGRSTSRSASRPSA